MSSSWPVRGSSLAGSKDRATSAWRPLECEVRREEAREGALAPLSGGDARRLTLTPNVDEFAPRWSPDGERPAVTAADAQGDRPTLRNPESLSTSRVRVLDRAGSLLAETPGLMPDWMPPW